MVTDEYGYNAVTTSPSSDFVQSDEGWWQTAWTTGATTAQATADPATQRVGRRAGRRDSRRRGTRRRREGQVRTVGRRLGARRRGRTVGSRLRVDLVDSSGKIIASSVPNTRFKPFGALAAINSHDAGDARSPSTATRWCSAARSALANNGRWRVIAHMNDVDAGRAYNVARGALVGGVGDHAGAHHGAAWSCVGRFIQRRITGPALELAEAAEAVAAGDLSKQVNQIGADDEIGRLARAVSAMIEELRRLAERAQSVGDRNGEHDGRDQRQLRGDGGVGRADRAHGVGSQPAVERDGRDDSDARRVVGESREGGGRPRRRRARRRGAQRAAPIARARESRASRRQLALARRR